MNIDSSALVSLRIYLSQPAFLQKGKIIYLSLLFFFLLKSRQAPYLGPPGSQSINPDKGASEGREQSALYRPHFWNAPSPLPQPILF